MRAVRTALPELIMRVDDALRHLRFLMQEVVGLRGITCLLRELQDAVRRTPPAREPFIPGPLPPGHDCGHELEGDRQRRDALRWNSTLLRGAAGQL